MTLHKELNKANKNNSSNSFNMNLDQKNQIEVFNVFLQNFMEENQSIINDIFYATKGIEFKVKIEFTEQLNLYTLNL